VTLLNHLPNSPSICPLYRCCFHHLFPLNHSQPWGQATKAEALCHSVSSLGPWLPHLIFFTVFYDTEILDPFVGNINHVALGKVSPADFRSARPKKGQKNRKQLQGFAYLRETARVPSESGSQISPLKHRRPFISVRTYTVRHKINPTVHINGIKCILFLTSNFPPPCLQSKLRPSDTTIPWGHSSIM